MDIMNYTADQLNAKKRINEGKNILLLGKPGTGKTALIKDIIEERRAKGEKVLITASTGLAAASFQDAKTIHSVLRWKPNQNKYNYQECIGELIDTDLLVVDEVSMLCPSILNHIYRCLEHLENKPQILFSGDFFQLPPTHTKGTSIYPFENPHWNSFELLPCILDQVLRQTDEALRQNLDFARYADARCIPYFNFHSRHNPIKNAISICTKNELVNAINAKELEDLSGRTYEYRPEGDCDSVNFTNSKIEKTLCIKPGMRIVAIQNDPQYQFQNGVMGTLVDIPDRDTLCVRLDNGKVVYMSRADYYLPDRANPNKRVKVSQFPIKAGYAITIHKCQGQTYEAANIYAHNCWEYGQLYVALTRVCSIEGLCLSEPISERNLKVDPKVISFYEKIQMLCA